jgi:hypothetical protein
MGTQVVGTLTHADAPRTRIPRACITLYNKYIFASRMRMRPTLRTPYACITLYNTHMKLFFAGTTHARQSRVREQIRVTIKPLKAEVKERLIIGGMLRRRILRSQTSYLDSVPHGEGVGDE